MRTTHTVFLLIAAFAAVAQVNSSSMLPELEKLTDQYDKSFDAKSFQDKIVMIYVGGADDPFSKVYDKWKGLTLKKNSSVQVVGGFQEMLSSGGHGGSATDGIKKHVQAAFVNRYGDKHFPILIDLNSEIAAKLSLKGLAVVHVNRKSGKVEINDFGSDRKKFFDSISTYFNP